MKTISLAILLTACGTDVDPPTLIDPSTCTVDGAFKAYGERIGTVTTCGTSKTTLYFAGAQ